MAGMARIIPVAAGKGGVGKTLIAANLATCLAQAGHATTVVDLDLGGSNLHSYLGLPNRNAGVGDFLQARNVEFDALPVPTSTPGLRFVPGDGRSPFMANITHQQKLRLIRSLRQLPDAYVVLDLGAGSSFNTLDFFALSEHGLLVVQPEFPAIMNMLAFLKQFLLRRIDRHFARNHRVLSVLRELHRRPLAEHEHELERLRAAVEAREPGAAAAIGRIATRYRPRIVLNQVDDPAQIAVAGQIDRGLRNALGMEADYFGMVFRDPAVSGLVDARRPLVASAPDTLAAAGIRQLAERVQKFWDKPVADSARRVAQRAAELLEAHRARG